MKRITILLAIGIVLTACNTTPDRFVVQGELTGDIENGTPIYLKTTDSLSRGLIEIDTTTIENGVFVFEGKTSSPQLHYLFIDGVRGNSPIIIENGTIEFSAQKDSLGFAKLKGSEQNRMFMDYLEESRKMASISKSFNADFRKAQSARDTAMIESLRAEYFDLQEKAKNFEVDFATQNPSALISALIIERAIATKVLPVEELQALYDALTPEIKATQPGKRIKTNLQKAKGTAIGALAPNFSGPTPDGQQLALADVKGKLTLIDFWAAWCKPCRAENPNIVAVYQKYKDKGLNVVGVSLDRKEEDWLAAIEADGLDWNHISNLKYFQDPVAKLYNVNAIPAAFLIDENGVIVAKNLRGAALEQKVAELLN
ncbi:MAG: AhpC/TSA family protein [Croceitalea sp.]|nr:AhpC/TSA family protein [Croceitalea sp.]